MTWIFAALCLRVSYLAALSEFYAMMFHVVASLSCIYDACVRFCRMKMSENVVGTVCKVGEY